ncbi:hypothetical protein IMZ48_37910 [Candidatus Bathyarchaeota archaeon]|nr:hypothetical protein [Candidatus Bathyarchaeota archaeon]
MKNEKRDEPAAAILPGESDDFWEKYCNARGKTWNGETSMLRPQCKDKEDDSKVSILLYRWTRSYI